MHSYARYALAILVALSLVPLAIIARARVNRSDKPRIHLVQDMDNQPRYAPQAENAAFADVRAMRPTVPGTVAFGDAHSDPHLWLGRIRTGEDAAWAESFPMTVTDELLERGQDRYEIFCTPCHGSAGYGDGMVARRADELQEGAWVPPSNMHTEVVREREQGNLYHTVSNGVRSMPAYREQIAVEDRWAVVAYVRALQRSQNATIADVPADRRDALLPE